MTDGQIHPLDEGGIQPSRKAHPLHGGLESGLCPQAHHVGDPNQLALLVAFFHLTIDQARCHLPMEHVPPSTASYKPVSKMGREGIKVAIEAITGKDGEATRSQHLSQGVDEQVGHVLGAWTQSEHGKQFSARVDGKPEP